MSSTMMKLFTPGEIGVTELTKAITFSMSEYASAEATPVLSRLPPSAKNEGSTVSPPVISLGDQY